MGLSLRGGKGEGGAKGGQPKGPQKRVRFVVPPRPASAPSSPTFTRTETEIDGQSPVDGMVEESSLREKLDDEKASENGTRLLSLRPTSDNRPVQPRRRSYPLLKAPRILSAFEWRGEADSGPPINQDYQPPKPSWKTNPDRPYWRDPGYGSVDWSLRGDHHREDGHDGEDGVGEGGPDDGDGSGDEP